MPWKAPSLGLVASGYHGWHHFGSDLIIGAPKTFKHQMVFMIPYYSRIGSVCSWHVILVIRPRCIPIYGAR